MNEFIRSVVELHVLGRDRQIDLDPSKGVGELDEMSDLDPDDLPQIGLLSFDGIPLPDSVALNGEWS